MQNTYHVADHNLALAGQTGSLGWCRLALVASRLDSLLDASNGSSGGRAASRTATVRATTGGLALGREDLVERLIELARHVDGCESWVWREDVLGLREDC